MAKATLQEEREVIVHKRYRLELTQEEADALAAVLGKVAGRTDGPRGHLDAVRESLEGAGVRWFETPTSKLIKGTLSFEHRGA